MWLRRMYQLTCGLTKNVQNVQNEAIYISHKLPTFSSIPFTFYLHPQNYANKSKTTWFELQGATVISIISVKNLKIFVGGLFASKTEARIEVNFLMYVLQQPFRYFYWFRFITSSRHIRYYSFSLPFSLS